MAEQVEPQRSGGPAGEEALPPGLRLALSGSHLIEASAGSGKTFTLVALFVRLVLERDLKVDQILVVTFTRAATAELRQRVRRRLIECREALDSGLGDPITMHLIKGEPDLVRARLVAAIAMIDSAPIYTIHGFAQRALADRAFSAGASFELELGDTRPVWAEAVKDFWRRRILHHDPASGISVRSHRAMVEHLVKGDSPEKWLDWLLRHRVSRHARIERDDSARQIEIEELEQAHADLGVLWRQGREQLQAMLIAHPALSHQVYSKKHVPNHCQNLDDYFAGEPNLVPSKSLIRLSHSDMLTHLKANGGAPPSDPLMHAIDAYIDLLGAYTAGVISWRQDLLIECFMTVPAQVALRLSADRRLGYDDLLVRLDQLLSGEQGDALARALSHRYPAALIDEFQDTDALQDNIFATIYRGDASAALFLVGDPKQAIYRFRGADVFTYLKAAHRVGERHALSENFRSSESLVAAVNALYSGSPDAFLHEEIAYRPARTGQPLAAQLCGDDHPNAAPLLVLLEDTEAAPFANADINVVAAAAVAAEIARMLALSAQGRLLIGSKPLAAGDIAVLVMRNDQGGLVRQALKRLGIGAADHSRGSVFAGEEADWLLQVLLALFETHRPERIMNALATPLFGVDAKTLAMLGEDETLWQQRLEVFEQYRDAWQRSGVMRLLRMLLANAPHDAGMLASAHAERHLTNLFHLAELMHAAEHAGIGIQGQIRWLAQRIELGAEDPEEGELRLESDDNLVQVMTVHKSKGLEFPVVFAPFMFLGSATSKARAVRVNDMPVAFHDPRADGELVIDFGGRDYAYALEREQLEKAAEEARLLYVALTRAVHRCVVFWGLPRSGEDSALTRLLEPGLVLGEVVLSRAGIARRLEQLHKQTGGQISHAMARCTAVDAFAAKPGPNNSVPRRLAHPLPEPWRMSSFTALFERRLLLAEASEVPDHDQDADAPPWQPVDGKSSKLRFAFARGAAAGECLHDVLEHLQFDLQDPQRAETQRAAVARRLRSHGFDARDAPALLAWLDQVLATPLVPGGARLADLSASAQIREMEFHLPLFAAPIGKLAEIARNHGVVVPRFSQQRLDGFLKGFIDLVFRVDQRYYIADYKSNWLGGRPLDYRGEHLEMAMQAGGYHLQYLLYCVALVRWLRWRDPAFDYEQHFGGVYYLFLRGIGDDDPMARPGDGIYAARPPKALIDDIDAILSGVLA
jgi:exodeoxyribonuclease V beta subunit